MKVKQVFFFKKKSKCFQIDIFVSGSIKQFGSPFNALLELTFKIPVKTFHQTPNVQQFPKQNVSPSSFQFDIIQSLQKYSDYKGIKI